MNIRDPTTTKTKSVKFKFYQKRKEKVAKNSLEKREGAKKPHTLLKKIKIEKQKYMSLPVGVFLVLRCFMPLNKFVSEQNR